MSSVMDTSTVYESSPLMRIGSQIDKTFRSTMAGDYAMDYLKRQYGE